MMNNNNRRETRASLVAEARKILDTAQGESRELAADEQERVDRIFADVDQLANEIRAEERIDNLEMEMTAVAERRTVNQPMVVADTQGSVNLPMRSTPEYRDAFRGWLRTGNRAELRALEVGTATEGGNVVDDDMAAAIVEKADELSFVRGMSNVITANSDIKIPVESTKVAAAIVAEEGAYGETDPAFALKTLSSFKLSCLVKVSEELAFDSEFDLSAYLARAFGRAMALGEDQYFLTGTGSGQPSGIFTDGAGAVTSAGDDALAADDLIDTMYSVPAEYRVGNRCAWVMNDSTAKAIRKLKDSDNQYLWQPALSLGQPDTLMGFPVMTNSNVAAVADGAKPVAFCNFDYFTIADRGSIAVQRLDELYAGNGQVGFRAYRRLDGKLTQTAACGILTIQ
tara:strand:- start:18021 stop:19217 length:1197 start_codon:yes stop_codon:yes gene_type:complete